MRGLLDDLRSPFLLNKVANTPLCVGALAVLPSGGYPAAMNHHSLLRCVRVSLLAAAFAALGACASGAGDKPAQPEPPSGEGVFTQGIALLCSSELIQERVFTLLERQSEWPALSGQAGATLSGMSVETARKRLGEIVRDLNEPHAKFVPGPPLAGSEQPAAPIAVAAAAPSDRPTPPALANNPPIPTRPVAQVLDGNIGYLLLPGCSSTDAAELRAYATSTRAAIRDIQKTSGGVKGWIVDLRLNGGGNVWPMLIGLRPLLGDGVMATSLSKGAVAMRFGCDGDAGWLSGPTDADRVEQLKIDPVAGDSLLATVPIAVLVHSWTMSSGELVAVALRDRCASRVFGEPTAGLTTSTFTATLDDGSLLTFPTHVFGGPAGRPVGARIEPDDVVPSIGWPGGDDAVAGAASAWIIGAR